MDCTGVCGGSILRDACGTCGGNDLTGSHCDLNFTVAVLPSPSAQGTNPITNNDIFVSIDASNSQSTAINFLGLRNTGNGSVLVTMSVIGASSKAPAISLSQPVLLMPGFSSYNMSFTTSLTSLFVDSPASFESKAISVQFKRIDVSDIFVARTVTVNPVSYNCSTVTNRNYCMNLPGCMYCLQYPSQRFLLDSLPLSRRLFFDVLPFQRIEYGPDYSYGECVDGWDVAACNSVLDAFASGGQTHHAMYAAYVRVISMILIVWLLL